MRLYLIKRRSDKKFYVGINGHYALNADVSGHQWSEKPGTFFRTPDGIARNLRKLCSEPYWNTTPPPKVCAAVAARWKEVAWRKFDGRKLKKYEVVIMDVDVISMTATPATEFCQIEAIRSQPINKFEREAS